MTDEDDRAFRLENHRMRHAGDLARWQAEHDTRMALLGGVFAYGGAALRAVTLVNGGAAVALLGLATHGAGQPSRALLAAMLVFVAGVLTGALATGASYVAQAAYAGGDRGWLGRSAHALAVLLVVAGHAAFAGGAWSAATALGF